MAPKVKIFFWQSMHGRLPTFEFLWPSKPWVFCGLILRLLIMSCGVAQKFLFVETWLKALQLLILIEIWTFLKETGWCKNSKLKVAIAICVWAFWNFQCNFSFHNIKVDFVKITTNAIRTIADYLRKQNKNIRSTLYRPLFLRTSL